MLKRKRIYTYLFAIAMLFILQTVPITAYGETIVPVDHQNTIEEIIEMSKQYPHSGFDYYKVTAYDKAPVLTAPYSAGSLAKSDLNDAVNAVKMVRFLAGIPYENVTFSDNLNNIAQHGAVLLAASNQFSHSPYKPADMAEEFYNLGHLGCSEANISAGRSNISTSVLGFMYDAGSNNITYVGHRRWILNPGNQEFGMGYAKGTNDYYGGHRINMHVFSGLGYWECESDSYIAWPSAGAFPIQYFAASDYIDGTIDCPWSVNLGSPYASPTKDTVVVKLTRTRDGKVWTFDKSTPDLGTGGYEDSSKLHLSVDNDGYGITKAIVFRPDADSLGTILDSDTFKVEISGIQYTDGTAATLSYTINFFDLEAAMKETEPTPTPEPTPSPEPTPEPTPTPTPDPTPEPTPTPTPMPDPNAWKNPFTDVQTDDWYYGAVEYAHKNNLFSGLTTTQFGPNVPVTRGMLVTVLHRAEGTPNVAAENTFTDVNSGKYYEKAVIWALYNGIVTGYTDTIFAPDDPISREEIVTIIFRYAKFKGLSVGNTEDSTLTFLDYDTTASYALPALKYCVANKIITGRTTTLFMPKDQATRAEMATILQRFLTKMDAGEL